jgi:peptide/nickel transport system ATP-binding protein
LSASPAPEIHAWPSAAAPAGRQRRARVLSGEEITHASGARLNQLRRELQIIFQDPFASLNPRMTVEQIVGEPLWLHQNMKKRTASTALPSCLKPWACLPPGPGAIRTSFPAGSASVSALRARWPRDQSCCWAMSRYPRWMSVQAQVVNLLESLKHQLGLTMVIVAHGLAVIRHMSDRVAVMYLGQIVELATVDEIFDAPLHPIPRR